MPSDFLTAITARQGATPAQVGENQTVPIDGAQSFDDLLAALNISDETSTPEEAAVPSQPQEDALAAVLRQPKNTGDADREPIVPNWLVDALTRTPPEQGKQAPQPDTTVFAKIFGVGTVKADVTPSEGSLPGTAAALLTGTGILPTQRPTQPVDRTVPVRPIHPVNLQPVTEPGIAKTGSPVENPFPVGSKISATPVSDPPGPIAPTQPVNRESGVQPGQPVEFVRLAQPVQPVDRTGLTPMPILGLTASTDQPKPIVGQVVPPVPNVSAPQSSAMSLVDRASPMAVAPAPAPVATTENAVGAITQGLAAQSAGAAQPITVSQTQKNIDPEVEKSQRMRPTSGTVEPPFATQLPPKVQAVASGRSSQVADGSIITPIAKSLSLPSDRPRTAQFDEIAVPPAPSNATPTAQVTATDIPFPKPQRNADIRTELRTIEATVSVADRTQDISHATPAGPGLRTVGVESPLTLPQLREGLAARLTPLVETLQVSPTRTGEGKMTTEVNLAPADLGRLKLTLQSNERGLNLLVIVERPEAMETVRRHLEGLHRSFMADGVTLNSVEVQTHARGGAQDGTHSGFRHPDQQNSQRGQPGDQHGQPHETAEPSDAEQQPIVAPGRLDISL